MSVCVKHEHPIEKSKNVHVTIRKTDFDRIYVYLTLPFNPRSYPYIETDIVVYTS